MNKDDPAWRWGEVLKALDSGEVPTDPFLKAVYDVMQGTIENTEIAEALELIRIPEYREPVIAFFLSGASIKEMSTHLNMSEKILRHFEKLVMDRTAFKHKLHWRRYANTYADNCETDEGKALVHAGMLMGPMSIAYHLQHGAEKITMSDKELIDRLAQTSFFKGIVAKGVPITSVEAREALRWAQTHPKLVAAKNGIDENDELELSAMAEIERFVTSKTPEEIGVKPEDILH